MNCLLFRQDRAVIGVAPSGPSCVGRTHPAAPPSRAHPAAPPSRATQLHPPGRAHPAAPPSHTRPAAPTQSHPPGRATQPHPPGRAHPATPTRPRHPAALAPPRHPAAPTRPHSPSRIRPAMLTRPRLPVHVLSVTLAGSSPLGLSKFFDRKRGGGSFESRRTLPCCGAKGAADRVGMCSVSETEVPGWLCRNPNTIWTKKAAFGHL